MCEHTNARHRFYLPVCLSAHLSDLISLVAVGVWLGVCMCVCSIFVFQAGIQHCKMGSKPQGGDPTAL